MENSTLSQQNTLYTKIIVNFNSRIGKELDDTNRLIGILELRTRNPREMTESEQFIKMNT